MQTFSRGDVKPIPRPPKFWAYFLRGGSGVDDATRRIGFEYGDPRDSSLLFAQCRRAVKAGAYGIYLQNPGGNDPPSSWPPPMHCDQLLRAAEVMGESWLKGFVSELAQFKREYPANPVLLYLGGLYGPSLNGLAVDAWFARVRECYAPVMGIPGLELGFDSSAVYRPGSREWIAIEELAGAGYGVWQEPGWLVGAEMRRHAIFGNQNFVEHLDDWAPPPAGARCLRILNIDPPIAERPEACARFVAHCHAYGHEPAVPWHLWGKDGRTFPELWVNAIGKLASVKAERTELVVRA